MDYLSVSVATLVRRHPWAQEVLEWHGLDLLEIDRTLSLSALCWLRRLDPERIVGHLRAANPDPDADEDLLAFLTHGEDDWEEPVTDALDEEEWSVDELQSPWSDVSWYLDEDAWQRAG